MTAVTLPNSGTKAGFTLGENDWDDDMNRNLRVMDALVQPRAIDKDLDAPPGSPAQGDVYVVGSTPTGAWSGHAGDIAIWQVGDDLTSAWTFVVPHEGWRIWVIDETCFYQRGSSVWVKDENSDLEVSRYSDTIGDGAATSFTLTHNLNTRNVHVSVYRNSTPWENVPCDVGRPSVDEVTIDGLTGTPTADEYVVFISR